jgi:hypothetical protein
MLNQQTIDKLKNVVKKYKSQAKLPEIDRWKSMTDSEIWISIVVQVGSVGSSYPAEKMKNELRSRDKWYEQLIILSKERRKEEIHRILYKFGIRYVSRNVDNCRKTNALLKNLELIESFGGPIKYIKRIAQIDDEYVRVSTVIKEMHYIKNKGARDLLISLGLLQNAIAFDVRIINVLKKFGTELPEGYETDSNSYKELESELIQNICIPCEITGADLDRILYQKYNEIVQ